MLLFFLIVSENSSRLLHDNNVCQTLYIHLLNSFDDHDTLFEGHGKVPKIKQNAVFNSCCIYFIFLLVTSSHDCPVPTCKAPKRRKHKRKLRLLPAKWRELAPEVKEPIIKELGEQRESLSVCQSVCHCVCVCLCG